MSYHTPAPWAVIAGDWDKEGRARYTLKHCAVSVPDARLIALAPEMFAFLKKWKTFNIEGEEHEQNQYDDELEQLLSKAEGITALAANVNTEGVER